MVNRLTTCEGATKNNEELWVDLSKTSEERNRGLLEQFQTIDLQMLGLEQSIENNKLDIKLSLESFKSEILLSVDLFKSEIQHDMKVSSPRSTSACSKKLTI